MNEEQIVKESLSTFCRLFFDFIPQVMSDLKHGINYVKQSTQNHTYRGVKGRRFDNESTFILENKARNGGRTPEIKSATVKSGRKDLKMLVKACKNRGVDVYIREKPSNFDSLVSRYNSNDNLSIREREMLEAFCDFDKYGAITNIHGDGGVLMFKAEDLQQVEEAVKDVDQKSLNIQRRKQKAKERLKKQQKQRNTKVKSRDEYIK